MTGRMTLPQRIDAALAKAGGSMSYFDLACALWPDRKSHSYSSNGGPPGCYMALSAGIRRGGFFESGHTGAGNRMVYARRIADVSQSEQPVSNPDELGED